jgi:hypothetical protein
MIGFSADQAVPLDGATLTDRAILAGREALAGRRRGLVSLLPSAGPAVMASVAYMDPGIVLTSGIAATLSELQVPASPTGS